MSATHRARGVPIDPAWRSQVLAAGSSKTFRPRLKGWGGHSSGTLCQEPRCTLMLWAILGEAWGRQRLLKIGHMGTL